MKIRRPLVALAFAAAACGSSEAAGPDGSTPVTPLPTIAGVGALPDTIARESEPPVVVQPPTNDDGTVAELVGQQVAGNRFLMIGDSILASTATRFGGEMCDVLVPLGWAVEVNAEPGRFVEFGTAVLDERLDPDEELDTEWDAAAVFLGSNYRGDAAEYEAELLEIVGRLAPRPTVLYTVTVYRPGWADVNVVIERIADEFEHITVIDWRTVAETPGVLSSDGLHPGDDGEEILVDLTAAQLGRAPIGEGECLRSQFTDDSAIGSGDTPDSGGPSPVDSTGGTTGGSSGGGSTGGSSGGTTGGDSTGGTTGGGSTGGTTGGGDSGGDSGGGDTGGDTGGGDTGADTGGGGDTGGDSGGDTGGGDTGGDSGGDTGGGDTGGDSGGGDSGGGSGGGDSGGDSGGGDSGGGSGGGDSGGDSGGGDSGGGDSGGGDSGGGSGGGDSGGSSGGGDSGGGDSGGGTDGGDTGGTTG